MPTELDRRNEYALHAPRVPKQTVEVFARNPDQGDYGLSTGAVNALFDYVRLQQVLATFDDLTFSPEFIAGLPEGFRQRLGDNLCPGISLADLEIPTSGKVLLAQLLIADSLTEVLADRLVDVWVNPVIQEELSKFDCAVEIGLQQVDYSSFSLSGKLYLAGVMEYQETQVQYLVLARECFPQGVPAAIGFGAMLLSLKDRERNITFDRLSDLDAQYRSARDAMDRPEDLLASELVRELDHEIWAGDCFVEETDPPIATENTLSLQRIEFEAERQWWLRYEKAGLVEAVADYLRPKYASKTIFEICEATTDEAREEVLCAFWRRLGDWRINLGDREFVEEHLYLHPDGVLELRTRDEVYDESFKSVMTGPLQHWREVAAVDQAVKWITQEMAVMREVKERWRDYGYSENQVIECTLANTIRRPLDDAALEEIQALPKWFIAGLNSEGNFYYGLPMDYIPKPSPDDISSGLFSDVAAAKNLLQEYFAGATAELTEFGRLLTTPEELYRALGLERFAGQAEIKKAYREIAKATREIHIQPAGNGDVAGRQAMKDKFMAATKAYKILMKRGADSVRITTLGRIRDYFVGDSA